MVDSQLSEERNTGAIIHQCDFISIERGRSVITYCVWRWRWRWRYSQVLVSLAFRGRRKNHWMRDLRLTNCAFGFQFRKPVLILNQERVSVNALQDMLSFMFRGFIP